MITKALVTELINACKVNVKRGHFTELYEGFNNCDGAYGDESRCNCGYKEALAALEHAAEYFHDIKQWLKDE